jgi:hypothetical protein
MNSCATKHVYEPLLFINGDESRLKIIVRGALGDVAELWLSNRSLALGNIAELWLGDGPLVYGLDDS